MPDDEQVTLTPEERTALNRALRGDVREYLLEWVVYPTVERIVAERLAAVRALAQQWNDTPDCTPSSYDMGRVAQRHDMTTQLWEVLGDA